jgi:hypothetical protein
MSAEIGLKSACDAERPSAHPRGSLSEILCVGHSMRSPYAPHDETRETGSLATGAGTGRHSGPFRLRSADDGRGDRQRHAPPEEGPDRAELGAELSQHLGYPPGGRKPDATTNHRNGTSEKRVLTDDGRLTVEIPRDPEGTFEPQLIPKHARRLAGFDDKVLALYARGLSVREIQKFLEEIYALDVSPDLISEVTDAVVAEVGTWQARPLEPMYPVVFFDALRVKIRDEAVVQQGRVSRLGGVARRHPRHPGDLGGADGRREVLAQGLQ